MPSSQRKFSCSLGTPADKQERASCRSTTPQVLVQNSAPELGGNSEAGHAGDFGECDYRGGQVDSKRT
jgi:hypothetical protein